MSPADTEQAPPPRGGRCVRARELAERREGGEELPDYESRLLSSHLTGCSACSTFVEQLTAGDGVQAGIEAPSRGKVADVEEERRDAADDTYSADDELEQEEEFEHEREQERASGEHKEPSNVDAMGQDKRREVVGKTYGATKQRQLAYYGIFVVFVVVLYIGASFAVSQLDKAPSNPSGDHAPRSVASPPTTRAASPASSRPRPAYWQLSQAAPVPPGSPRASRSARPRDHRARSR